MSPDPERFSIEGNFQKLASRSHRDLKFGRMRSHCPKIPDTLGRTQSMSHINWTLKSEIPILEQSQSLPRLLLDACIILYAHLVAQRARATANHASTKIAHMPQRRIEPRISQHLLTPRVLRQLKHARRSRSPHIDARVDQTGSDGSHDTSVGCDADLSLGRTVREVREKTGGLKEDVPVVGF